MGILGRGTSLCCDSGSSFLVFALSFRDLNSAVLAFGCIDDLTSIVQNASEACRVPNPGVLDPGYSDPGSRQIRSDPV